MASGLQALVLLPGQSPVDVGPPSTSCDWSTNALGGFGSATITLPGEPRQWVRSTPKLSSVRLLQDGTVVFEGQIEDHGYTVRSGEMSTTVQCFGLARLLSEISVRRIWSKRDLQFRQAPLTFVVPDPAFDSQTGNFDPADLTKNGVQIVGNGGTSSTTKAHQYLVTAPTGVTLTRVMCTHEKGGNANLHARIFSSPDHSTYTNHLDDTTNHTIADDFALVANAVDVKFDAQAFTAFVTASADRARFYDIRILGTSLTEDAAGGLYGGSVLRDLIGLVPGLSLGTIESGSEFTIESIERAIRSASLNVVQEVASYYDKEWGIYEGGRFDWKSINLDKVDWIVDVSELETLDLRSSVDDMSSVDYVLYTDAATGLETEASATSTSRANPYVLRGRARDILTSPGFPMTTNTSAQLAARLNAAHGIQSFASGSCSMGFRTPVSRGGGGAFPAFMVRAGENIKITGLPKNDPFNTGRDGETLFHIVSTQANTDGKVTLTLDSQSQAIDSLMARLAAATRTLTG